MKFCRRPLIVAVYTALLFPLYSRLSFTTIRIPTHAARK